MYKQRIAHLEEMHRVLDKKIESMIQSKVYNDENLSVLKKEKLRIKDEIALLNRKQWEHDHETVDFDDER
jgi:hypothetical protein